MRRKEISASLEKVSWRCHKAISRGMKTEPWNLVVLDWGAFYDADAVIHLMMLSFVEKLP